MNFGIMKILTLIVLFLLAIFTFNFPRKWLMSKEDYLYMNMQEEAQRREK